MELLYFLIGIPTPVNPPDHTGQHLECTVQTDTAGNVYLTDCDWYWNYPQIEQKQAI